MKLIRTLYLAAALAACPSGLMGQTPTNGYFLHTVTKGQSLYSIAVMYNLKTDDIVRLNPGSETKIKAGELLRIPQKQATNGQPTFHTIQSGETLYQLAQRYGISAQRICHANPGLSAERFRAGQVIAIPPQTANSEEKIVEELTQQAQKQATAVTSSSPLKPNCRDMHKVKRRETIFSISREYGITEAELIEANPELKTEKLKKGHFLCIPYPKTSKPTAPTQPQQPAVIPSDSQLIQESRKEARKLSTLRAAVLLPFMADGSGNREEQVRMVEYYEGFLMAVDSLKSRGVNIDLHTFDTKGKTASIQSILNRPEMKEMDIVFGPTYPNQVKEAATFTEKHDIRLVVPFSSKGEEVFNNPSIYQINTPQSYLYSEVYEHFSRKFSNPSKVIFLDAEDGNRDKQAFISGLKDELRSRQTPFTELRGAAITPEALKMAADSLRDNIFIPTSGTNVALIKLLPQLIVTTRDNPNYRIQLFGYPEWQTYTHDHLASFYELDTYFYSSFYTNNLFPAAVQFGKDYRQWYSKDMLNSFPKYGMLGFDTAYFFLKGLSQFGNRLEENVTKVDVTPIQTGFKFERVNNWGGFINRKVFFVHFTKNYELIKLDFE